LAALRERRWISLKNRFQPSGGHRVDSTVIDRKSSNLCKLDELQRQLAEAKKRLLRSPN
jgi:hypothetical protein